MTCFHCKRPYKTREAKRGLVKWSYVPYTVGTRFLKRWWCSDCWDCIDAEYPEDKHEAS